MLSATLTLDSPAAAAIYGSISPEAGREIPRTKISASRRGQEVVLTVEATDLAALRAALNSYLRWIKVAEDMSQAAGDMT
jgi:KEOPS complex subunit Pcc1